MVKAGAVGAVVGFIYVMGLTLLSPFCTFCFTPLLGIGVGYLAGKVDEPVNKEASLVRGSIAGAISGLSAVAGQMAATVVNGILVTRLEDLPAFINSFGFPPDLIVKPDQYWQGTLITGSLCGMLNLMIMVSLGAFGSMLWFQRQSRNEATLVSS